MNNKIITPAKYYMALGFYLIAAQAQAEVRKFERKLEQLLGDNSIGDAIYQTDHAGTKDEFDAALAGRDITVDWMNVNGKAERKKAKSEAKLETSQREEREEQNEN